METTVKYLEALKDIKKILRYQPKLAMLPFCKEKGLSTNTPTEMIKGGLLKNVGTIGRGAVYEWTTIEPNIKMAEELLNRVNRIGALGLRKTRGGKREGSGRKTKLIENRYLDHLSFKLLFGLMNIKINLNYKVKD